MSIKKKKEPLGFSFESCDVAGFKSVMKIKERNCVLRPNGSCPHGDSVQTHFRDMFLISDLPHLGCTWRLREKPPNQSLL